MNAHRLPEGFNWRMTPQPNKEYARLLYRNTEIAVIRQMGRGWIAVINDGFSSFDSRACAIPDGMRGQIWLATWARKKGSFIQSVCLSRKLETRRQEWLALGRTPLRSAI